MDLRFRVKQFFHLVFFLNNVDFIFKSLVFISLSKINWMLKEIIHVDYIKPKHKKEDNNINLDAYKDNINIINKPKYI